MGLVEASKIYRKHLNPFVQYFELGQELPQESPQSQEKLEEARKAQQELLEKLDLPIEHLELGARASNCLSGENIRLLKDLVIRSESDLLKIRNFGKTSLSEIKERLQKLNLTLGMELPETTTTTTTSTNLEKQ